MTLAKGRGNGIPVEDIAAKKEYGEAFGPGAHGSTFGGNPIAMAAAQAVLSEVFTDSFLENVEQKGQYLYELLQTKIGKSNKIKEIRRLGLMMSIECHEPVGKLVPTRLQQ